MPISIERPTDIFDRQPGANSLFGKKADRGGYDNLTVHRYPSDVGKAEYPHYLMFYVFTTSEELKGNIAKRRGSDVTLNTAARFSADTQNFSAITKVGVGLGSYEVGKRVGRSMAGMLLSATGGEALIRAGGVFAVSGGVQAFGTGVEGSIDVDADDAIEAGLSLGGQLGGAAVSLGALASLPRTAPPDRTMLNKAIALYMPNAPSVSYQAGWGQGDIGAGLGVVGDGLNKLIAGLTGETIDDDGKDNKGLVNKVLGRVKAGLEGLGSAFSAIGNASVRAGLREADKGVLGELGSVQNAFSASTRQAFNPYRVQLFTSMGFRNFSFTYKFLPKNSTEYQEIKNIIQTFKLYMHPKKVDAGDLFIGYPAEFIIGFYHKEKENPELFKTGRSVLTNMRVTYGDEDFVTFKELPGAPAEINLSLTFTEVELLDRATIEEGY